MPTILQTFGPRYPVVATACGMWKASVRVITTETRLRPCQTERQGLELQKKLSLTLRVLAPRRASELLLALEVLGRHLIEEFTEFLYLRLLGLIFPHADARFLEDLLGGEDRGPRAHCEGDGIGRPAGHLVGLAVCPHADHCVEGALPQLRDVDALDGHPELLHDVLEELVGHRPLGDDALESEGDGGGLDGADPDREEAAPIALLQQHDGLIGGQLDPDSDERNLDHLHRLRLRPPEGLPPNNIRLVYSRGGRVDVARPRIW